MLRIKAVLLCLLFALVAGVSSIVLGGSTTAQGATPVTKVLVFMEENHSLAQMQSGMPYAYSLARQYGYANSYTAITHPSLPNYLAIAGGDTFGVTDDAAPSSHPINAQTVFGQALALGKTAKTYAESMPSNCALTGATSKGYAVKHNPWTYFTPTAERAGCNTYDVPETKLSDDITAGTLPNVGMVLPNQCNDAHDCSLATADNWFKSRMTAIMAGPDWQAGRLVVVLTADEDDKASGNQVLTVVIRSLPAGAGCHHKIDALLADPTVRRRDRCAAPAQRGHRTEHGHRLRTSADHHHHHHHTHAHSYPDPDPDPAPVSPSQEVSLTPARCFGFRGLRGSWPQRQATPGATMQQPRRQHGSDGIRKDPAHRSFGRWSSGRRSARPDDSSPISRTAGSGGQTSPRSGPPVPESSPVPEHRTAPASPHAPGRFCHSQARPPIDVASAGS